MKKSSKKATGWAGVALCAALTLPGLCTRSHAQNSASQTTIVGNTRIQMDVITYNAAGGTIEGKPVVFQNPDIEIRAPRIDWKGPLRQFEEIRAQKQVSLKANLAALGGATGRVEATSDLATYDRKGQKLTLRGHIDGWYETARNGRTKLRTEMVVLYLRNENLMAELSGGVQLGVPPEATGKTGNIGAVTITSRDATVDEAKGEVRFTGNARAVSDDTANKLDVAAPEFILTRSADGTIDTIRTAERTMVKMDLPPDPEPAAPVATVTTAAAPNTPDASSKNAISKPTHVEVAADSAVITRGTNTLVLKGNIQGFYILSPAGAEPERYNFVGERAELAFVPVEAATAERVAGLNVRIERGTEREIFLDIPTFDVEKKK